MLLAVAALPPTTSARTHATPSPSPTPVADPAITRIVEQQFVGWQAGIVDKTQYAQPMQVKLTDAQIAKTSHALGGFGALTGNTFIGPWVNPDFPPGARGYIYQMHCVLGSVYLLMALDAQGKIATLFFKDRLDVETVTPSPSPT